MNKVQKWIGNLLGLKAANPPRIEHLGGTLSMITDNTENYIRKAYAVNDIVYSIVNIITSKAKQSPFQLYKISDDSSLKAYEAYSKQVLTTREELKKLVELRHKALEPVKQNNKITELLKYPNEDQDQSDFTEMLIGFKLLTGNGFCFGDKITAGANEGLPNTLNLMPSQYTQIIVQTGFPGKKLGYQLSVVGSKKYDRSEVMHIKEPNYLWSVNGEQHYGMSKLKAALLLTNRDNSALEASTAKFQNGGVDAILYVDSDQFTRDQRAKYADNVKEKLITEWTGVKNQGKIATAGYKMGAVNLGLSPVDLAIIDAEKWDMRRFCNIFKLSSYLMNDPDNKQFNTAKEGARNLITNCVMPELTAVRGGLNRQFTTHWGMKPIFYIDYDLTVYPELQEGMGEMMKWIADMADVTGIPANRILELLGLETIDDPEYDMPRWTQRMGTPINDYRIGEVDNALNENNDESGNTQTGL